jgi:diguanylate cyclase (GGDEF)-like protein
MKRNGWTKPPRGGSAGVAARSALRLPRAHLEQAIAKLTEENARLRREVLAHSGLWQIAHQDPLTALWNRRYADLRLAEELSRSKREKGYRFSMVLVDVDHLKRINDQLGHAAGDEALRWVATFLKQGLRTHDLCCRLGGDEFLLILPASGAKECGDLVERIRRRWRIAVAADGRAVALSMGTASFPSQGTTVASLLALADDAMYENKRRQDPSHPEPADRRKHALPVAIAIPHDRSGLPDATASTGSALLPPPERLPSETSSQKAGRATVLGAHATAMKLRPARQAAAAAIFKCLLFFLASAGFWSCATRTAAPPYDQIRAHGLTRSAPLHPIALVAGPVMLHADASTPGWRVYLAHAITGTDLDCAAMQDAITPAVRIQGGEKILALEVPTGSIACVVSDGNRSVEILWHALGVRDPGETRFAAGVGPIAGCCANGR